MTLQDITASRIFVTGFTGCGKTTLAAKLKAMEPARELIEFDKLFDYINNETLERVYLAMESHSRFVIDALPNIGSNETHNRLVSFMQESPDPPAVIVSLCDKVTWLEFRIPEKRAKGLYPKYSDVKFLEDFDFYHTEVLKRVSAWLETLTVDVYIYHSTSGKLEKIGIRDHLKRVEDLQAKLASASYDKGYQNIDVLGQKGYDDSDPSWRKIQQMPVSFEGKTVCDLGCFHGFYSIKAALEGASSVIGLDRSSEILSVSELIAQCSGVDIGFQVWEGGQPTPECDIALVLNMLHHCENQSQTLQNIQCKNAIFEVNRNQLSIIESVFRIQTMKEGRSYPDRESRLMIYAEKK